MAENVGGKKRKRKAYYCKKPQNFIVQIKINRKVWPFHVNNGLVETCTFFLGSVVRASTSLLVFDVRDIWDDSDKKEDRISFFLDWSETNGIKLKTLHYHSHGSLKHLDSKCNWVKF